MDGGTMRGGDCSPALAVKVKLTGRRGSVGNNPEEQGIFQHPTLRLHTSSSIPSSPRWDGEDDEDEVSSPHLHTQAGALSLLAHNRAIHNERLQGLNALTVSLPGVSPEMLLNLISAEQNFNWEAFSLSRYTNGHPLSTLTYWLIERKGLVDHCRLDRQKLMTFLRRVEGGYNSGVPYHSSVHAADVVQSLSAILIQPHLATPLELLAGLLAAAIHDVNHLGLTNDFLVATRHEIVRYYGEDAPMELHSACLGLELMADEESDFLRGSLVGSGDVGRLRRLIFRLVVDTDFKRHRGKLDEFCTLPTPGEWGGRGGLKEEEGDEARSHPLLDLVMKLPGGLTHAEVAAKLRRDSGLGPRGSGASRSATPRSTPRSDRAANRLGMASAFNLFRAPSVRSPAREGGGGEGGALEDDTRRPSRGRLSMDPGIFRSPAGKDFTPSVLPVREDGRGGVSGSPREGAQQAGGHALNSPSLSNLSRLHASTALDSDFSDAADVGLVLSRARVAGIPGGRYTRNSDPASPAAGLRGWSQFAPTWGGAHAPIVLSMALKMADLGHAMNSPRVHCKWVELLEEERFRQGDLEKSLGLPLSFQCDRQNVGLTGDREGQLQFITMMVKPLVDAWKRRTPGCGPLVDSVHLMCIHYEKEMSRMDPAA